MIAAGFIFRMCLGGLVCGVFAGILGGALVGTVSGIVMADFSLGLDGALLGGACVGLAGAVVGLILGIRDKRNGHMTAMDDSSTPDLQSVDR